VSNATEKVYSAAEVAAKLGISKRQAIRLVLGEPDHRTVGNMLALPAAALQRLKDRRAAK
jgi:hypothetical protein